MDIKASALASPAVEAFPVSSRDSWHATWQGIPTGDRATVHKLVGGFPHPFEKYATVKLDHFRTDRGENKT